MSYHWTSNRRPGLPLDGQDIHALDCSCSDCRLDRRRSLRLDLLVIALGIGAALVVAGLLLAQGGY